MKIAITADLHLTSTEHNLERYHALENILNQMVDMEIPLLVIAGDLFDSSLRNYSEFEKLCKDRKYRGIEFYIIPGNHDHDLNDAAIVADNVKIFAAPRYVEFDSMGFGLLMVPYEKGKTMGESIEPFRSELPPSSWILIGHGDWTEGLREPNPYEPGVYMPLTSKDVDRYQPNRVFLGHIHNPLEKKRVHYVGSPCGLDIAETGKRSFLMYDSEKEEIEEMLVDTDIIFFDEYIVMLPTENERAYIREQIETRIGSWDISENDRGKVIVRIRVKGYCSDKASLLKELQRGFSKFMLYKGEDPDISGLSLSSDLDRMYIADKVNARITELEWAIGRDEPDEKLILEAALKVIYGG